MKSCKRVMALLCCAAAVLLLLPLPARAAGDIDLSANVGVNLTYRKDGVTLSGATFHIYRVADVAATGELTATAQFASFPVRIRGKDDEAWRKLASTLDNYIQGSNLTPADTGTTDDNGKLTFPTQGKTMRPGLYLVRGERLTKGTKRYDATPFFVMLPSINKAANKWEYVVSASPKCVSSNVPTPPANPGGGNPTNNPDPPAEPTTITRRVVKMWDDDGFEDQRPAQVTVSLLRDGRVYDTVQLNAGNNWRHTWTELDDRYTWAMVERPVNGDYIVGIWREGVTFVVSNTYGEEILDEEVPLAFAVPLPRTGLLWWPVPLLTMAGLLLVIVGLARRRGVYRE